MALAGVLPFLSALGCESLEDPGPRTEVRDSAGITIVENTGEIGPDGGAWMVAPEPVLSIGTFQGDPIYQLFQVQGAKRLGDGRIAVANAGSGEIRFFDGQGSFLAAVGRKGEGPGEFERPALVGVFGGDTLVVVDNQLRRISLVHPEEGFLESTRLSDDLGGGGFPWGMFADRTLVLGGGFYFSSAGGIELSSGFSRRATNYQSADLDGELVTDFGEFPGSEFFMQIQNQGGGAISMMARLIPFGKHAMQAVAPDRFYYASGDLWEIQAFDPAGELRRLIRFARDPMPVRSEDLEALIQEEIAELGEPSEAPGVRAAYEEMPVPDVMPALAGLHADALGYLWVEEYRRPGDDTPVFDILDPDGAHVGRVTLPEGMEILEVGDDYLLALYQDELGVEYVKVLTLLRPVVGGAGS
jgi:hypothetical protein